MNMRRTHISRRNGMVNGFAYGYLNRHSNEFRSVYGSPTEDVERSCRFFNADGIVLRYSMYSARTEFKAAGGINLLYNTAPERKAHEEDAIRCISDCFPQLLEVRTGNRRRKTAQAQNFMFKSFGHSPIQSNGQPVPMAFMFCEPRAKQTDQDEQVSVTTQEAAVAAEPKRQVQNSASGNAAIVVDDEPSENSDDDNVQIVSVSAPRTLHPWVDSLAGDESSLSPEQMRVSAFGKKRGPLILAVAEMSASLLKIDVHRLVESAPPKEERREDSPEEPSVPSTDPAPSPTAAPTVPAPARCKIFTLWEYPREAPLYARLNDLSPIVDRLADHDLISYATVSNPKGVCSDSFSSNFIAGRKGSEMWVKQKKMITKHCPLSDKSKEIVCCFDDPKIECHIPFAGIGEGTSHPMLNQLYKNKVSMKTYCFADEESFVPDHFAYVLEHVPDLEKAYRYLEERNIKRGLDRMAFHMFNSIIPFKNYNCKKLFTKGTTVGQLYLTAFGTGLGIGARAADAAAEAFLKEHPDFQELQAKYEGGWPCKDAHKVAPSVAKFKARAATAPSPAPEASVTTVEGESTIRADRAGGKCRIYTYWEYEGLGPLYLRLNVESWRRNARCALDPKRLATPIYLEVPDVPEEFFRLPYPEARADFIKWGLVYNNGGIFMEPDVLMSQDIEEEPSDNGKVGASPKQVFRQEESDGSCTDQFNPAVVAGPPKGIYFKAVWEKHKAMLQHHCPIADKQKEIICCFDDTNERCHIPWLAMNRGIAHPIIRDWSRSEPDRPLRSFCFNRHALGLKHRSCE
eukprot:s1468_g2.t1